MVHEVDGKRKQGWLKMKYRKQVKGNTRRIGLRKEDVADWCRWRKSVGRIAKVARYIGPPPVIGDI